MKSLYELYDCGKTLNLNKTHKQKLFYLNAIRNDTISNLGQTTELRCNTNNSQIYLFML